MPVGGDSPHSQSQPLIPPLIAAHVAFRFRLFPEIRSDDASYGLGFEAERLELFGLSKRSFSGGGRGPFWRGAARVRFGVHRRISICLATNLARTSNSTLQRIPVFHVNTFV